MVIGSWGETGGLFRLMGCQINLSLTKRGVK